MVPPWLLLVFCCLFLNVQKTWQFCHFRLSVGGEMFPYNETAADVWERDVSYLEFRNCHQHLPYLNLEKVPYLNTFIFKDGSLSELPLNSSVQLLELLKLSFRHNNLTDLKDGVFNGVGNLEELDLSENRISTVSEGVFLPLNRLRVLRLNGNNMSLSVNDTFDLLGVFEGLESLQELYLQDNRIFELKVGLLYMLKSLRILDVSGNEISTIEDHAFSNMVDLEVLRLNGNIISTFGLHFTQTLSKLRSLYLNDNRIANLEGRFFASLGILETLDVSNNRVRRIEGGAFSSLVNLEVLCLNDNNITRFNSSHTRNLGNLRKLYLQNNQIIELQSDVFQTVPSLRILNLSNNKIVDLDERLFENLTALNELTLNGNTIRTNLTLLSESLPNLTSLNLEGGRISNALVLWGLKAKQPLEVNLNCNNLTQIYSDGPFDSLTVIRNNLTGVQILDAVHFLDLSHNRIRSLNFHDLPLVKVLILNHNDLTILDSTDRVDNDYALTRIDLTFNKLGRLTAGCFRHLTSLEHLNLTHNNISAVEVGAFEHLSQLVSLDLSYNALETLNDNSFYVLSNLNYLYLKGNHLAKLDGHLIWKSASLRMISFDQANFSCATLVSILNSFKEIGVRVETFPAGKTPNVRGILCNDDADERIPDKHVEETKNNELILKSLEKLLNLSREEAAPRFSSDIADVFDRSLKNTSFYKYLLVEADSLEKLNETQLSIADLQENVRRLQSKNNTVFTNEIRLPLAFYLVQGFLAVFVAFLVVFMVLDKCRKKYVECGYKFRIPDNAGYDAADVAN